jgi:serine O-acetyltransferase
MLKIEISADIPDWAREKKKWICWDPSRSLLNCIRAYQRQSSSKFGIIRLLRRITAFRYRIGSIVTGADIPLNTRIEGGLKLPHPNGIVIHPVARIGPNFLIFQRVTIGTNNGKGPPRIGGHVDIGAGAKVLGDIEIGNHARIGANAVVLENVPAGMTPVGIPAKIVGGI